MLSEKPCSFSEMQEIFKIESSLLTYHLESLGSLLSKTEEGKYALSAIGEAAVSMMYKVEEPLKTTSHPRLSSKKWKALLTTLTLGLILLFSLCYFQYQALTNLSSQFLSLKEENEFLREVLMDALGIENATLTHEYTENSTIATTLVTIEKENQNITHGICIISGYNVTWVGISNPWGPNCDNYFIYSLIDNSTLEIEISFPSLESLEAYLLVEVGKEVMIPVMVPVWTFSIHNETIIGYSNGYLYEGEQVYYETIWDIRATNSSTYSVTLPLKGWYCIQIHVPSVWNATDHYIINYTISFRVKSAKNYIPFFTKSRMEGFDPFRFSGKIDFLKLIMVSKDDP
jgi:hypothetical protein